jgi:hypothetical protein
MRHREPTIEELAASLTALSRRAVDAYAPLVEGIVVDRCQDVRHIERTLDGLLDFCFDPEALNLYKTLWRYYHAIDPAAAAYFANAYREHWDAEPQA